MALDPHHCHITHHAYLRYANRRHGLADQASLERNMRELLARCAHRNPPIVIKNGHTCRLYNVGELVFVVSADNHTVITVFPQRRAQPRHRKGRPRGPADWRAEHAEAF